MKVPVPESKADRCSGEQVVEQRNLRSVCPRRKPCTHIAPRSWRLRRRSGWAVTAAGGNGCHQAGRLANGPDAFATQWGEAPLLPLLLQRMAGSAVGQSEVRSV